MKNHKQPKRISWWKVFLFNFWPAVGVRIVAREVGVDPDLLIKLHEMFEVARRIDIVPNKGGRGFKLILNGLMAFEFYQEGDHFLYGGGHVDLRGFERGDITVFDDYNRRQV